MDSRVTFLVGPTFFHTITLARPAGSTWSRRDNQSTSAVLDNQSMRECSDKRLAKGSTFFSYKRSLTVVSAGKFTLFPATAFLRINGTFMSNASEDKEMIGMDF